jgi:hypothetical protein
MEVQGPRAVLDLRVPVVHSGTRVPLEKQGPTETWAQLGLLAWVRRDLRGRWAVQGLLEAQVRLGSGILGLRGLKEG